AIFPFLVTGWVTAAGGAWNTCIVAEYWKVAGPRQEELAGDNSRAQSEAAESSSSESSSEVQPWEETFFSGRPPADARVRRAFGLGAIINRATEEERYALLAAAALLMAFTVVFVNRLLWHRLGMLAEKRYSLNR